MARPNLYDDTVLLNWVAKFVVFPSWGGNKKNVEQAIIAAIACIPDSEKWKEHTHLLTADRLRKAYRKQRPTLEAEARRQPPRSGFISPANKLNSPIAPDTLHDGRQALALQKGLKDVVVWATFLAGLISKQPYSAARHNQALVSSALKLTKLVEAEKLAWDRTNPPS
jgi:hypothetical protein